MRLDEGVLNDCLRSTVLLTRLLWSRAISMSSSIFSILQFILSFPNFCLLAYVVFLFFERHTGPASAASDGKRRAQFDFFLKYTIQIHSDISERISFCSAARELSAFNASVAEHSCGGMERRSVTSSFPTRQRTPHCSLRDSKKQNQRQSNKESEGRSVR